MRLVGRILFLVAGASVPAVVAVIGCNVESDPYMGIGNKIPNGRQGGVAQGGTPASSSGTGTSSSSSSSSGGGVANQCQCAWAFEAHGDAGACTTCGNAAVMAAGACATESQNCTNDGACVLALTCVVSCPDSDPTCTEGCLPMSSVYQALVACQCAQCAGACSTVAPIPCDLGDAGDGGDGG